MGFDADIGEHLLRLLAATGAGMVIGLEREWREKAAGFRTLTLVSMASALIVMLGDYVPGAEGPRLAAGVVTGIGFLGAGVILRDSGEVYGLTTAAAVWMSAALGIAAGLGAYLLTAAVTVLALLVLLVFPMLDISRIAAETRFYEIVTGSEDATARVAGVLRGAGLLVRRRFLGISGDTHTSHWSAIGKPAAHEDALRRLIEDEEIGDLTVR